MNDKKIFQERINQQDALNAIRKKLVGKTLNYKEIYSIMDQIAKEKLGQVLTTYFAASTYSQGFSNQELYYLTKAMVETGEKLHFKGIVADKHSIGGVPGNRTTLIVVPIVAAAGFLIPKSSSRVITTSGTADDMEILAPVILSKEKILKIVKKIKACIVWGGNFNIAPADDVIINVEKPLMLESFDKIIISIMSKKIAFGSTHVVIDVPYGNTLKLTHLKDAKILKSKFEYIAKKFKIKIRVLIHRTDQPIGKGMGPILETKDALKVLEQTPDRPFDLEVRSITLAGNLLELCLKDSPKKLQKHVKDTYGNCMGWAKNILQEGLALKKMKEIILEQGGNQNIKSSELIPGKFTYKMKAGEDCVTKNINSKNLTLSIKALGAPLQKKAGIYLDKKEGEKVKKGDSICTFYSENVYNLKEGKETMRQFPIFEFQ
ncbi:MAG: thymidine phosphorylase [Candidatus Levybacteria bacterium]|nr:thymidine phosphorylase [Candidatus Levybacteria bacterium]MDZ4228439.1 thymidine phosphorylase [Candidatus Levybacteria bacterium]